MKKIETQSIPYRFHPLNGTALLYCIPIREIFDEILPALLKRGLFSILAKGLFGSGSSGVPSTRLQSPTIELQPK